MTNSMLRPELVAQVAEQLEHRRLHGDIQCGRDLVADDDVRPGRQRPRDADALALPAGQLARIAIGDALRKPDLL